MRSRSGLHLLTCAAVVGTSVSFIPAEPLIQPAVPSLSHRGRFFGLPTLCSSTTGPNSNDENLGDTSTYETSDASSKGIVSGLTQLVNFIMGKSTSQQEQLNQLPPPPASPTDLLSKIRDDYVENNYLWTGNIYVSAFAEDCRFTDPTLSFVGRDKFISNVQNLRPVVDALIEEGGCESKLLDISLNEEDGYVQSRWNMVGDLTGLPWKPRIDVIGRTKFWYKKDDDHFRVFFYDEKWEMPAAKALLQLVTKPGTISNGSD